jgi:hypothetical protein
MWTTESLGPGRGSVTVELLEIAFVASRFAHVVLGERPSIGTYTLHISGNLIVQATVAVCAGRFASLSIDYRPYFGQAQAEDWRGQ